MRLPEIGTPLKLGSPQHRQHRKSNKSVTFDPYPDVIPPSREKPFENLQDTPVRLNKNNMQRLQHLAKQQQDRHLDFQVDTSMECAMAEKEQGFKHFY
jgi:hypothetical protein